jgi:hypothetical protein
MDPNWKLPKSLSTLQWDNKLWYMQILESYVIKRMIHDYMQYG